MVVQERFQLDKLFGEVLHHLVSAQPPDPLQYIIDHITYTADYAKQVPARVAVKGCAGACNAITSTSRHCDCGRSTTKLPATS